MKKIMLCGVLASSFMFSPMVLAKAVVFNATTIAKTQLDSLSFKNLMRTLYPGQMVNVDVQDESIAQMPHIGLGRPDRDNNQTVAVMHPVLSYPNTSQQKRYLVMIEKLQVSDGAVQSCHACSADADLYLFKQLPNGRFQLVSRSAPKAQFGGSWGRVDLDLKQIQQNLQPFGKQLTGSYFKSGYTSTGTTMSSWQALFLSENDYIRSYEIADGGADNAGNYEPDSPLFYNYTSTLKIIPNGAAYYPVCVTYTGEKPMADDTIRHVNYSENLRFDPVQGKYKSAP